eukprot:3426796-Rhodomonas_salina.1
MSTSTRPVLYCHMFELVSSALSYTPDGASKFQPGARHLTWRVRVSRPIIAFLKSCDHVAYLSTTRHIAHTDIDYPNNARGTANTARAQPEPQACLSTAHRSARSQRDVATSCGILRWERRTPMV